MDWFSRNLAVVAIAALFAAILSRFGERLAEKKKLVLIEELLRLSLDEIELISRQEKFRYDAGTKTTNADGEDRDRHRRCGNDYQPCEGKLASESGCGDGKSNG